MQIQSVYEFAWLTTQQIVVTSDKEGHDIKGFGSGFFFHYRDNLFMVTADHVRCNAIHQDLRLEGTDSDGYYILKNSGPVKYEDWAGLSGGPVFNDKGELVGMAIQVNDKKDTVTVVPMKRITELMDYAIKDEETHVATTN